MGGRCPPQNGSYDLYKAVAPVLLSWEETENKNLASPTLGRSSSTSRTPASSPGWPTQRFVQEQLASGQGSWAPPLSGSQTPTGRCFLRSLF